MKVLFVCLGNICRSPTAEAVMKKKATDLNLKIQCDSAGTSNYHKDSPADERASLAAKKRGYDLSQIRSRPLDAEDFYDFDYILAMDQSNYEDIMALRPDNANAKVKLILDFLDKADEKNVPDPYWSGPQGFETVLDLIEDAIQNFLKQAEAV